MTNNTIKTSLLIDAALWREVKARAAEWAKEFGLPAYGATSRWVGYVLKKAVLDGVPDKGQDNG